MMPVVRTLTFVLAHTNSTLMSGFEWQKTAHGFQKNVMSYQPYASVGPEPSRVPPSQIRTDMPSTPIVAASER